MRSHPALAGRSAALALALALAATPALAQEGWSALAPEGVPGSLSEAASMLADAGENALLVRDLLGMELEEPSGETAGTVVNFVVVPGGRLVAAMVETPEGERLPVPFAAITLAGKAGAAEAALAQPLSEIVASAPYESLRQAIPQPSGG